MILWRLLWSDEKKVWRAFPLSLYKWEYLHTSSLSGQSRFESDINGRSLEITFRVKLNFLYFQIEINSRTMDWSLLFYLLSLKGNFLKWVCSAPPVYNFWTPYSLGEMYEETFKYLIFLFLTLSCGLFHQKKIFILTVNTSVLHVWTNFVKFFESSKNVKNEL